MGFGGFDTDSFRLFIDNHIFRKSYSRDSGDTYEEGILTLDSSEYLKVLCLEVWGFPDNNSHKIQNEYRRLQHKKKMRSANNTKNALFSGDYNQVRLFLFVNQRIKILNKSLIF